MASESKTTFEVIADGLDAFVDGRGWGAEHEKAKNLANSASELLEALKAVIPYAESRAEDLSDLKARGEEDPEFPGAKEAWEAVSAAKALIITAEGRTA